ncbi:membrane protein insertase YidC [Lysobacter solisilvae (ex Woo and Kim 2020)]|uniref:Membrane protein insertase YidC n=1 Tax=Agrilutibacter terrestris TaxID=2865112 RepID=A0A7H0G111_9GAMM|nr:membrane protein insertase YidC [Lysobacter terrestris]QNP41977.1 membrane protein insertase YidC [Lysobacter terrestris]
MNQTRLFLIFAWLMVATLLWMEWGKEKAAPAATTVAPTMSIASTVPGNVPAVPTAAAAPVAPGTTISTATRQRGVPVTVVTDVLRVNMDGGVLHQADLLRYPSLAAANSAPVRLLADDGNNFFVAQSGWVSSAGAAPSHEAGFQPEGGARSFQLADGQRELVVPFVWNGANGVSIRRTYTFQRGSYVVQVRDEVRNAGTAPWQGYVYRQLSRVPRALVSKGPMNAESYSFQGAAWFDGAYDKRKYDKFVEDGSLDKSVTGGWIGMLQHHFFAAWIPQANDASTFTLAAPQANGTTQYLIRELGPGVNVAPGGQAETSARLWVGPKLVKQIEAQQVKGLDRAVDFSSFGWAATLAGWLFWVLDKLHGLLRNWGWAIVGLVVLLKAAMYPLSAAQYKSMAKMRKFQPRIKQLQERYGDDKQKMQMAMMELYKKEKINPVGGCLPILLQMPVFLCLYWMLSESVELRHAPWIGWITDLTARDPYFILPAINLGVMFLTQKMTPPAPGMDPMQQKMMQWMPVVFGVLFAFMPAGLVLYWITNGSLGLLQQWWMTKRYAEEPAKPATA